MVRRLPLTACVCTAGAALAQTPADQSLSPVLVSATRFAEAYDAAPPSATLITAAQIRQAGVGSVNEAIRSIAGVYGRRNSTGSSDYSLDLRGFGATADQNTLILVDGVRLSENELSVALLSSIPIETVERIEILRGGSSVLYGGGATAGVIQVITRKPQRDTVRGSVAMEAGGFGTRGVRGALARDWQGLSLDINVARRASDNYRDNNYMLQENIGGGLQWSGGGGRMGLRVDHSEQRYGLAGGLTRAQFLDNPRGSSSAGDRGTARVDRVTLSGEQRLGPFELAAEWSQSDKSVNSRYSASVYRSQSRSNQFSPRARYQAQSGDWINELVAGVDFSESTRIAVSAPSVKLGKQASQAVYLRDELRYGRARLVLGARREKFNLGLAEKLAASPVRIERQRQTLDAWDVQGSVTLLPQAMLFAGAGRSYRVANVDENGLTPTLGQMLRPQQSNDLTLGFKLGDLRHAMTVTAFQHRLHDEIMYDPTVDNPSGYKGANTNLDPTLRRGVELALRTQLQTGLELSASVRHVDARFTDGNNSGKEVALVPRNTASVRLDWSAGRHRARVGAQWVSSQRYGGDFANTCQPRMPAFVTLDGRYAITLDRWELALSGSNLANRQYFSQAYSCEGGIFPESGRQLLLSARYDF